MCEICSPNAPSSDDIIILRNRRQIEVGRHTTHPTTLIVCVYFERRKFNSKYRLDRLESIFTKVAHAEQLHMDMTVTHQRVEPKNFQNAAPEIDYHTDSPFVICIN